MHRRWCRSQHAMMKAREMELVDDTKGIDFKTLQRSLATKQCGESQQQVFFSRVEIATSMDNHK